MLLARSRTVDVVTWLVLIFIVAYTVAVVRDAPCSTAALLERLPSGKEVFGDGSAAHRLPQLISIPSYLVLLAGTLWSAWTMRGRSGPARPVHRHAADRPRRHHRGRWRNLRGVREPAGFCVTLVAGIVVMYAGFLRASSTASGSIRRPYRWIRRPDG